MTNIILCGANGRLISTENNPTVGNNNLLRIKSGAGFLDSAGALEIANYIQGKMRKENRSSYKREKKIYLSAGETLRVVLCYLKSGDEILTRMNSDNAVIEIYAPNGDAVAVSDDPRENVKLAEYTASYEGEYTMICRAEKFGDGGSIIFGAAWRIY